jgi:hypothetical protein
LLCSIQLASTASRMSFDVDGTVTIIMVVQSSDVLGFA